MSRLEDLKAAIANDSFIIVIRENNIGFKPQYRDFGIENIQWNPICEVLTKVTVSTVPSIGLEESLDSKLWSFRLSQSWLYNTYWAIELQNVPEVALSWLSLKAWKDSVQWGHILRCDSKSKIVIFLLCSQLNVFCTEKHLQLSILDIHSVSKTSLFSATKALPLLIQ